MLRFIDCLFPFLLPAFLAVGLVRSQPVAWQPPANIRGDADVSKSGNLVDAVQFYAGPDFQGSGRPAYDIAIGDTTFHAAKAEGRNVGDDTITLKPGTSAQSFNANLRATPDPTSLYNAAPAAGVFSADYSKVIGNGTFFEAGPVGTISIRNLTEGHDYQIQIWCMVQAPWRTVMDFTDSLGNTASLDARAHLPDAGPLAAGQVYGQRVTGVFKASTSNASIDWAAADGTPYPIISAAAVRDVTGSPGVEDTVAAIKAPPPIQPRDDVPGFEGIQTWKGLTYARVGRHNLKLDLFVPHDASRPVPLVVYIHGGGWVGLDRTEGFANGLVRRGFALATVDYRLSHEAIFPAQIQDCKAAVRWLRVHGGDYGLATEKIGAIGDSAGGNLVSLLGVTAGNPDLEGDEGNAGISSAVQAVADYFGPSNILEFNDHKDTGMVPDLLGGSVDKNEAKARLASPLFAVTSSAPPFLIVHGDSDKIVPIQQSIDFHDALKKAGVPVQLYVMRGAGHGANNDEAFNLVVALFNKYLR